MCYASLTGNYPLRVQLQSACAIEEAVSDLCELQGALVRAWRGAAKKAEVV